MNTLAIQRVSNGIIGSLSGKRLQVTVRPDVRHADTLAASIHNLVLRTALEKLLRERHFNVIGWDNLCELARVVPDGDFNRQLRALHCVNWSDMPVELREAVVAGIVETISAGCSGEAGS